MSEASLKLGRQRGRSGDSQSPHGSVAVGAAPGRRRPLPASFTLRIHVRMSDENTKRLRQVFQRLDSANSGFVPMEQLSLSLKALGLAEMDMKVVEKEASPFRSKHGVQYKSFLDHMSNWSNPSGAAVDSADLSLEVTRLRDENTRLRKGLATFGKEMVKLRSGLDLEMKEAVTALEASFKKTQSAGAEALKNMKNELHSLSAEVEAMKTAVGNVRSQNAMLLLAAGVPHGGDAGADKAPPVPAASGTGAEGRNKSGPRGDSLKEQLDEAAKDITSRDWRIHWLEKKLRKAEGDIVEAQASLRLSRAESEDAVRRFDEITEELETLQIDFHVIDVQRAELARECERLGAQGGVEIRGSRHLDPYGRTTEEVVQELLSAVRLVDDDSLAGGQEAALQTRIRDLEAQVEELRGVLAKKEQAATSAKAGGSPQQQTIIDQLKRKLSKANRRVNGLIGEYEELQWRLVAAHREDFMRLFRELGGDEENPEEVPREDVAEVLATCAPEEVGLSSREDAQMEHILEQVQLGDGEFITFDEFEAIVSSGGTEVNAAPDELEDGIDDEAASDASTTDDV